MSINLRISTYEGTKGVRFWMTPRKKIVHFHFLNVTEMRDLKLAKQYHSGQYPGYLCLPFCTIFLGGHPKQQKRTPLVLANKEDFHATAIIVFSRVFTITILATK
jgi:hypothetical protein